MDDHLNIDLTLTKQRQEQKIEENTTDMRAHLTGLQNWDLAEGQTIEQRRAEQRRIILADQLEYNERLVRSANKKMQPAVATETAQGQPAQIQQPAEETYKQRRERARLEKEARNATPMADETSAYMVRDLKHSRSMRENSFRSLPKEVQQQAVSNHVDVRVMKIYAQGCQLNWRGKTVSDRDAAAQAADMKYFKDWISCNLERRRPHLDRIVEQALSVKVIPDMFAPEYMKNHAGEVHKKVNMLVCFDNIIRDPVNRPYFDALPQITKDLIEQRIMSRYTMLGSALTCACAQKAVDVNVASYMRNVTNAAQVDNFRNMHAEFEREARNTIEETSAREQELVQRELERRMELEKVKQMETAEKMKAESETMEGDIGGLNFTGYVTGYSFDELAKYRKMIEEHPAEYAKNPQLIDSLYQGMHHTIDALGDVTLQLMAAQGVMDEAKSYSATDRVLSGAAGKKQEKDAADADLIRDQLSAHADALQALLRGKPLTDSAADLLHRMGH